MVATPSQYSEYSITRILQREKFKSSLLLIDNCYGAGSEADLLIVTPTLKMIDVEIKISRQDLKRDRVKDKWYTLGDWKLIDGRRRVERVPIEWPRRIWKHYYCVADPIWQPSLLEYCNPNSGVFSIKIRDDGAYQGMRVHRRAKPKPDAYTVTARDLVNLSYLAGIRMLEAYRVRDLAVREYANAVRRRDEILDQHVAVQVRPDISSYIGTGDNDYAHAP